MSNARAVVLVTIKPSPVAAWFHHLLTTPIVEIDGREHVAKWGTAEIAVGPGDHRMSVYFRYRWQERARLAEASRQFSVEAVEDRVHIGVRLGPRNGSTFRIAEPVNR
ncbi:hypothetical protein ABZ746_34645 [Streptomyces sp. NPDC020096]|jgi:hypothetical protein